MREEIHRLGRYKNINVLNGLDDCSILMEYTEHRLGNSTEYFNLIIDLIRFQEKFIQEQENCILIDNVKYNFYYGRYLEVKYLLNNYPSDYVEIKNNFDVKEFCKYLNEDMNKYKLLAGLSFTDGRFDKGYTYLGMYFEVLDLFNLLELYRVANYKG